MLALVAKALEALELELAESSELDALAELSLEELAELALDELALDELAELAELALDDELLEQPARASAMHSANAHAAITCSLLFIFLASLLTVSALLPGAHTVRRAFSRPATLVC